MNVTEIGGTETGAVDPAIIGTRSRPRSRKTAGPDRRGNRCWYRGYLLASNPWLVLGFFPSARSPSRSPPWSAASWDATSRPPRIGSPKNERTFAAALSVIETRYVDKVESDRLVYGGISGMLQTLDPHSNFMDPQAYAQLRERQEGRYYGLGITISAVDGDITVVSLFEGSPAYKQGIRRGDVIAKIERAKTRRAGRRKQAVRKLRGAKGTTVDVYLKRPGIEGLFKVSVDARRDHDSDDPCRVHARRADRLRPPAGLRRAHRSATWATRCAISTTRA